MLEDHLIRIQEWNRNCHEIINKKMSVHYLQNFISQGEKLLFDVPRLSLLKSYLSQAQEWVDRYERINVNDAGDAAAKELLNLLPEIESLPVDLSEHASKILERTRSHCLCRQRHYGQMIMCECCEEWYHLDCIGMTKSQVCFLIDV